MSTVTIDLSRSFLIVRVRSAEMYSTVVNTVYGTAAHARSESPDLDRMTERDPNSKVL
jgi:hypothetical protein